MYVLIEKFSIFNFPIFDFSFLIFYLHVALSPRS